MLINSWNGFFSIGSSFIGLGLVLEEVSIFLLTFRSELFSSILITFSDLGIFISSEYKIFISYYLGKIRLIDNI